MKKPLLLGIASSFFFAFTFILNRSMNLDGGSFLWSAALRFIFMLPLMYILVCFSGGMQPVLRHIRRYPVPWLLYSTIGFGFFYFFVTMASVYGESWLVAALWQLTIVCGIVLTPLFGAPIPRKPLAFSLLIIVGVFLLQMESASRLDMRGALIALGCILIAAFSYPYGNRRMMQYCQDDLNTSQRVFGMTLMSMPFWLVVSGVAYATAGVPSNGQMVQSFFVALFSGVIATLLFFKATNIVKHNLEQLAIIEATQCGEVIFTFLIGVAVLHDPLPHTMGYIGLALVIIGMILCALAPILGVKKNVS